MTREMSEIDELLDELRSLARNGNVAIAREAQAQLSSLDGDVSEYERVVALANNPVALAQDRILAIRIMGDGVRRLLNG